MDGHLKAEIIFQTFYIPIKEMILGMNAQNTIQRPVKEKKIMKKKCHSKTVSIHLKRKTTLMLKIKTKLMIFKLKK